MTVSRLNYTKRRVTDLKKYDTVIFDLDGTLLNSLEDLTDSVNYVLSLHDFPRRDITEIRNFVGNGVGRLIELSIPDGLDNSYYEQCISEFRTHYSKNMGNKTRAYDGIMDLFGQLSNEDFKMAIVSNKFDAAVKELAQSYFPGYIQVAIGESINVARKPAPDSVIKALEQLGSVTDKAVYVGDSEVDVKTAKNAGLTCIGVTWGFRDREILEREGANYIINKPEELLKVVCE